MRSQFLCVYDVIVSLDMHLNNVAYLIQIVYVEKLFYVVLSTPLFVWKTNRFFYIKTLIDFFEMRFLD